MILDYLMERLQSWGFGNVKYIFITITPRSTLTQNVVSVRIPSMELFDKELFIHLAMSKQMTKFNWIVSAT